MAASVSLSIFMSSGDSMYLSLLIADAGLRLTANENVFLVIWDIVVGICGGVRHNALCHWAWAWRLEKMRRMWYNISVKREERNGNRRTRWRQEEHRGVIWSSRR